MTRKKLWVGFGIAGLMILIIGLSLSGYWQRTGVSVQVFKVRQEDIEETVPASGTVEVAEGKDITAQVSGQVQDVLVQEGDPVKAGQVLVRLEASELIRNLEREEANLAVHKANLAKAMAGARPQEIEQDRAALKRAKAAYTNAKAKYERSQVLYKEGAISKESLEAADKEYVAAESDYRIAQQGLSLRLAGETKESIQAVQAQVKQAEIAANLAREWLARAEVKASTEGVVLFLEAEKGRYVTTGTLLAVVGKPEKLKIVAGISESDVGRLAVGQPVKINSPAIPDGEFSGKVIKVSPAALARSGSGEEQTDVQITVDIMQTGTGLKPGYTVDLNITTASISKALVIPQEAVMEKNRVKEVFVVEKGKTLKRRIQTGIGNEVYVTVKQGLRSGDKVVVNPPDKLTNGSVVNETSYGPAKLDGG